MSDSKTILSYIPNELYEQLFEEVDEYREKKKKEDQKKKGKEVSDEFKNFLDKKFKKD